MSGLVQFLGILQKTGLAIDHVYDIGACNGTWSVALKNSVLPHADFTLFEANDVYAPLLAATGFRNIITVLSNPGRDYADFFNGTNTGDSYYKETTKYYDAQTSIRLPCTTLDQQIEKLKLPIPNFIKLDTQGSELDILAGATSILDKVDLIYTECPIVRYNAGAPDMQDYLDFFRTHNFLPVGLLETHYIEHTLLQVDIMFMRKETKEKHLGTNEFTRPWMA